MRAIKKVMSLDDKPDSYMDNSPSNDTGPSNAEEAMAPETPDDSMEAGEPAGEDEGSETATLSTEMLKGQDVKPGMEIRLRVTAVSPEDGTVTVTAASGNGGAISKAAKAFDMKGSM